MILHLHNLQSIHIIIQLLLDVSLLLKFETASCRVIKPSISDLVIQHDGLHVGEESRETIDGVKTVQPVTLFIIPTGEEVLVERKEISYKGILASNKNNLKDLSQEMNVTKKMRKNITSSKQKKSEVTQTPVLHFPPIEKERSPMLTDFDVKNRLRGYSLFLPESKEQCDEYWRVAYGVNLHCEREGEEGEGEGTGRGYDLSEVTMQLGDKRILPSQMLAR